MKRPAPWNGMRLTKDRIRTHLDGSDPMPCIPRQMTSGRCHPCGIVWYWPRTRARLPEALCQTCGKGLAQTCAQNISPGRVEIRLASTPKMLHIPAERSHCADCGEPDERTGHQTCQYPGRAGS